jgi:D-glycero-D-manno-heptose 1,7-bisphosphate phosphatase
VKPAIFIERDGVLIHPRVQHGKQVPPRLLTELTVNVEAAPALRKLKAEGFLMLVTTHQPGLSRGYLSRYELERIHHFLRRVFPVDAFLVCPHDEMDHCPCCTPNPGLLMEAAHTWHADLSRSFVISDKWQDAQAAHRAGCTSLLLRSPWNGNGHHDFIVSGVAAAAGKILHLQQAGLALAV